MHTAAKADIQSGSQGIVTAESSITTISDSLTTGGAEFSNLQTMWTAGGGIGAETRLSGAIFRPKKDQLTETGLGTNIGETLRKERCVLSVGDVMDAIGVTLSEAIAQVGAAAPKQTQNTITIFQFNSSKLQPVLLLETPFYCQDRLGTTYWNRRKSQPAELLRRFHLRRWSALRTRWMPCRRTRSIWSEHFAPSSISSLQCR